MFISEAKVAVKAIFETKLTPCLVGVNGIGKTEMARQLAHELGYDGIIELRLGTMGDVGDLVGLPYKTTDSTGKEVMKYAKPWWFPETGRYIIFIDEFNRARKDMQQGIFQLIREHRILDHVLPEGSKVLAACNPSTGDYDVVDLNDDAYTDRFAFINITPDIGEWAKYNKENGTHEDIVNFVKEHPTFFTPTREDFSYQTVKFSPRSWADIDAIYRSDLPEAIMREVLYGIVGIEATQTFLKFKDMSKLPEDVFLKDKLHNRIKEAVDRGRFEQIKIAADSLFDKLESGRDLTKTEFKNFVESLSLLPKDLRAGVVAKFAACSWDNKINTYIDNFDTAIDILNKCYFDKPLSKDKLKEIKDKVDKYKTTRTKLKEKLDDYLANEAKKGKK